MKKIIFIAIWVFVATTFITCSQTNEPKQAEYKDPREMTWTADTLVVPDDDVIQILPRDMLVLSPDDIWLSVWIGHAQMWHYDGTKWENKRDIGGGINTIVRREGDDIWAGGYSGDFMLLAHYEGTEWATYKMLQTHQLYVSYSDKNIRGEILDMCVDEENNLWACGRKGIIFKFDGINWDVDTVRIPNYSIDSYFLKSIEYFDNKLHVLVSMYNSAIHNEAHFYITGNLNNWSVVDSMIISIKSGYTKWGSRGLFASLNDNLVSYGETGIWDFSSSIWTKILDVEGAISSFYSISQNYEIAVGDFRKILYFSGSVWEEVNDLLQIEDPHFCFSVSWTDGYEIFVGGYTVDGWPQRGIIWHGK